MPERKVKAIQVVAVVVSNHSSSRRTVDCSQPIAATVIGYPDDPPVTVDAHATMDADGYRVTRFSMGSHTGTHVDAPAHTESAGRTLDDFAIDDFHFDALRVDCTAVGARDPIDADLLTVNTPEPLAETDADLVVVHTGWDDHWNTRRYRDHPYLTDGAAALLAGRGLHVGVDALSVDPTPTENATSAEPDGIPAHHALLGAGTLIVENLANLDLLPDRFTLSAYPLALADAEAAPARAVAQFDQS